MIKFKLGVLLAQMGYRQDDVAQATKISKNTLSNIVNNKTSGIQNENLEKLALFLNVGISELFEYYPAFFSLTIDEKIKESSMITDPFGNVSPIVDDKENCLSGITLSITKNSLEVSKIPLTILSLKNNGAFGNENHYIALVSSFEDSFVDGIIPDSITNEINNSKLNIILADVPNVFLPDIKTKFQDFITNKVIKEYGDEWAKLFPDKNKKVTVVIGDNAPNKRFII